MSFSFLRRRARASFGFRSLAIGMLLWPVAVMAEPTADAIAVNVDQAKLVKLPTRVATIVVGNPLIADVTLQTGGILVVTGKGYGATNFIAMDRAGEVLVDRVIQVEGPTDQLVTIYRGVEREVLQLHADLPAAGHARRRRDLFQVGDGSGRHALAARPAAAPRQARPTNQPPSADSPAASARPESAGRAFRESVRAGAPTTWLMPR